LYSPACKTRNWPARGKALKCRGSLTIHGSAGNCRQSPQGGFDPTIAREALPTGRRDQQPDDSDAAMRTCLTTKLLLGMALRKTMELVESLLRRISPNGSVPTFSTLSRRRKAEVAEGQHPLLRIRGDDGAAITAAPAPKPTRRWFAKKPMPGSGCSV